LKQKFRQAGTALTKVVAFAADVEEKLNLFNLIKKQTKRKKRKSIYAKTEKNENESDECVHQARA
jgi:hypothetical protein